MPRVEAKVISSEPGICDSPSYNIAFDGEPMTAINRGELCPRAVLNIKTGENAGKNTLIKTDGFELHAGQEVYLTETPGPNGTLIYAFADFGRSTSLMWWAIGIVAVIVAVATLRGFLALLGLAVTFVAVAGFLIPGLLQGESPVALALTCGSAILFVTLFLVHGVNWKTASALCGTLTAVGLAAATSQWAINSLHLQGLGNEENLLIQLYLPQLSVRGLMLCGFIIGALGVLNDVTIAQASTVQEIYDSAPQSSVYEVFRAAMRVGKDHIASMVYTLVLSYTGAALPMLLLLHIAGRPLVHTLTGDLMATELMRSGVGALALVCAVPITTAIAAFAVRNTPEQGTALP
ncbi:YibE/F family protein [Corynebacterium sp. H130]|uniref:YibE/F family protein n=1 Tax=Corynebacterium sp. H130 TaxID=3133444 RepID=UPI003096FCEE